MPICEKCRKFFPPGFVDSVNKKTGEILKGNLCLFCIEDKEIIETNSGKKISKDEIVKEYTYFINKIKHNTSLLKNGIKDNSDISKLIL